ncbi:sigma-70 family RNA polymerase sigma factor [Galbibacter sp. EGI 63066]|uniref:RNA polymerase sigma factor n=1 Tax=Galbibacter sp. EGI 63066 TaxID=2993559 RepID=UPI00224901DF|nr:sigma-70 family RNA polymerase sigma factor [Galbibacter sp. EGI 63066]MCX2681318.1 sigma-70 family RNA polymerase sigma factor [Galbibacter sp. EGI 63066]
MLLKKHIQDFLKFKPELQSFLYRLLTNKEDVEDIVQETYIRVHQNINTFKGKSSFKTWVFTIALNLSKNHLKKQKRWVENAQDYGAELHANDEGLWDKMRNVFSNTPDKTYEIKEHIAYCSNCIFKTLELRQQICLWLKEVYHFKINEIMEITTLSKGKVKHAIANGRKNMVRIFDNRCSFVNKKGVCHQCTVLKGNLNPEHNAQVEAIQLKMVKEGDNPDKEHLLNLRFELTSTIDPLNAPNSILNTYMLENIEKWVEEGKQKKVLGENEEKIVHGCEL